MTIYAMSVGRLTTWLTRFKPPKPEEYDHTVYEPCNICGQEVPPSIEGFYYCDPCWDIAMRHRPERQWGMDYRPFVGQKVKAIDQRTGVVASQDIERRHQKPTQIHFKGNLDNYVGIISDSGHWEGWFNWKTALIPLSHPSECVECGSLHFSPDDYVCNECRTRMEKKL